MFKYILNRLTARSTWLGVIGLITACGATLETALAEQIKWVLTFVKLIQRRAYGFRNFENYRLRVLIECGHFYIPQKDVFNNVWG